MTSRLPECRRSRQRSVAVNGIAVNARETDLPKLCSRVGMVFQHFALFPNLRTSTHWLLTACSMAMLEKNGNAFDAGTAAAFVRPGQLALEEAIGDQAFAEQRRRG